MTGLGFFRAHLKAHSGGVSDRARAFSKRSNKGFVAVLNSANDLWDSIVTTWRKRSRKLVISPESVW
jgi:hypothetical protein